MRVVVRTKEGEERWDTRREGRRTSRRGWEGCVCEGRRKEKEKAERAKRMERMRDGAKCAEAEMSSEMNWRMYMCWGCDLVCWWISFIARL